MELHAFEFVAAMADAHDDAVIGFGGDGQLAGKGFALDDERMIARGGEGIGQLAEKALTHAEVASPDALLFRSSVFFFPLANNRFRMAEAAKLQTFPRTVCCGSHSRGECHHGKSDSGGFD